MKITFRVKITFRAPSYRLVIFQYSPTPIFAGEGGGAFYGISHILYIIRFQPVVKTLVNETISGTINGI